MAQAAPKSRHSVAAPGPGQVAAGGPIADLQRTIEERLLLADREAGLPAPDGFGVVERASRLAGPALLVAAYAALAMWWF